MSSGKDTTTKLTEMKNEHILWVELLNDMRAYLNMNPYNNKHNVVASSHKFYRDINTKYGPIMVEKAHFILEDERQRVADSAERIVHNTNRSIKTGSRYKSNG